MRKKIQNMLTTERAKFCDTQNNFFGIIFLFTSMATFNLITSLFVQRNTFLIYLQHNFCEGKVRR